MNKYLVGVTTYLLLSLGIGCDSPNSTGIPKSPEKYIDSKPEIKSEEKADKRDLEDKGDKLEVKENLDDKLKDLLNKFDKLRNVNFDGDLRDKLNNTIKELKKLDKEKLGSSSLNKYEINYQKLKIISDEKLKERKIYVGNYNYEQISNMVIEYINVGKRKVPIVDESFWKVIFGDNFEPVKGGKKGIFFKIPKDFTDFKQLSRDPKWDISDKEYRELARDYNDLIDEDHKIRGVMPVHLKLNNKFEKKIGSVTYDITLKELADYYYGKSTYIGSRYATSLVKKDGRYNRFLNHSATVAKGAEPSMMRLVSRVINGITDKEEMIQKWLYFINKNITYDYNIRWQAGDFLKRPNEVMMSGRGDCSGKTISFVSGLEQMNVDYVLIYLAKEGKLCHIASGVKGDFEVEKNAYYFKHNGQTYHFCESTASRGWKIGGENFGTSIFEYDIAFIQEPGKKPKVFKGFKSW